MKSATINSETKVLKRLKSTMQNESWSFEKPNTASNNRVIYDCNVALFEI